MNNLDDTESIFIAFVICLFFLILDFSLVWVFRRELRNRFGVASLYTLIVFTAVTSGMALLWCASLLPPVNTARHQEVSGIGGGAYGLQFELYPHVSAVISSLPAMLIVAAAATSRCSNTSRATQSPIADFDGGVPLFVLLSCSLVILTLGQFLGTGYEYLILGELPSSAFRRDGTAWNDSLAGRVFSLVPLLSFLAALAAAALPAVGARCKLFSVGVLLGAVGCLFPIASASRSLVIVSLGICVGWMMRFKGNWFLHGAFCALLIFLSFSIPLQTRSNSRTGTWANLSYYASNSFSIDVWRDRLREVLQNSSVAFPILVEGVARQPGDYRLSALPLSYRLKMLSPLPSVVDGFADDLSRYKPRINPYTPYSSFAELYGLYGYCGLLLPVAVALLGLFLTGALSQIRYGILVSMCTGSLISFSLLQLSTYDTRTGLRYFYLALIIGLPVVVLDALRKSRNDA